MSETPLHGHARNRGQDLSVALCGNIQRETQCILPQTNLCCDMVYSTPPEDTYQKTPVDSATTHLDQQHCENHFENKASTKLQCCLVSHTPFQGLTCKLVEVTHCLRLNSCRGQSSQTLHVSGFLGGRNVCRMMGTHMNALLR